MITEVFKLVSRLKDIKEEELIIDDDDIYIIHAFHRKLKGIISFNLWKNIVKEYSITNCVDIYESCDILVDEIYNKYKKK